MKHKYNTWQKACGWPVIYEMTANQYGRAEADELMDRAKALYVKCMKQYGGCKGIKKIHVQSAAAFGALYLPLKEMTGSGKAVRKPALQSVFRMTILFPT